MKLYVNKKPDGRQMPVLAGENGRLHIAERDCQPDELSPGQAIIAMFACVKQGWEWERVA